MWKTLISTLLYVHVVISQVNPEYNYETFMEQFNRTYQGQQKEKHKQIFNKNYVELVDKRNQGEDLEVNDFLDWNQTQREHFFNYKYQNNQFLRSSPLLQGPSPIEIPKQFDWRKKNVVSSIKHQKQCGGCYAFASVGLYEGLVARETGVLYNLSPQYALECDMRSGGCEGGYPSTSLQLYRKYGIPLQEEYPYRSDSSSYYTGLGKPICNQTNKAIKLKGSVSAVVRHRKLSKQKVQQFLVRYGPLVVAVSTNNPSFMYAGSTGLINKCTSGKIDHAVLLVGYNTTHWFIKNSWGTVWGHQGFGYIAKQNDCQLTSEVIFMQYDLSSKSKQIDQNISLQIQLKSKNSRGWGGNVIQFRQNNITITRFGQGFLHGNTQGPFNISIFRHIQIQLIHLKKGSNLNQIGFTIKDPDGMIILQQIFGTMANMKNESFCPSFQCVTMDELIPYTLHLTDASGDTWQGTVLAFSPAGSTSSFTMDELGESKGPIRVLFPKKISQFSIVVRQKGQFSGQVGFTLENSQKKVVAKRQKMVPISVDRILGKVKNVDKKAPYAASREEDNNYLQIQNDGPKKIKINESEDKNIEIRKLKVAIMSLGILSALLVIGFGIIIVKMYKTLRKENKVKSETNQNPNQNIQSTEQQSRNSSNNNHIQNNHENTVTMLKGHTKMPIQKITEITNNN